MHLLNVAISNDTELPIITLNHHIAHFCIAFIIFKVPAFGWQSSLQRGVVKLTWPILNFGVSYHISRTAEAEIVKFCMQVDYTNLSSVSLEMCMELFVFAYTK